MKQIPKIYHLFWDGFPMSFYQVFTVISFKKFNPDWEIIIWLSKQKYTELGENTFVGAYTGKDYFGVVSALPYVQIKEIDLEEWGINTEIPSCSGSDIFRMKVLHKYGGVYSDFDVIWVRPISVLAFVEHIGAIDDFECSVCFYDYIKGFQNVSVMAAKQGASYLQELIRLQAGVKPPYSHQSYGSELITNHFPTLPHIWAQHHKVLAVKYETFYPYSIYCLDALFNTIDLSPMTSNAIAVHWFCGHEISLQYLNKSLPHREENSFTKIINQVIQTRAEVQDAR